MRNLHELDRFRRCDADVFAWAGSFGDRTGGVFTIKSPVDNYPMNVIASSDGGWDHVSVSRRNRCPNWHELEHVKRLFFEDHETAMQLHVPPSQHVSLHPFCLHLWRPQEAAIPMPPVQMV